MSYKDLYTQDLDLSVYKISRVFIITLSIFVVYISILNLLSIFGMEVFIVYPILFILIGIHYFLFYKNKKYPFFRLSEPSKILAYRFFYVILMFFYDDHEVIYYMILYCSMFFIFERIYIVQYDFYEIKGEVSNHYPNSNLDRIVKVNNFHKITIKGGTHLNLNEIVIVLLAFLLPFQNYISFDIVKISLVLYSLNIFMIFLGIEVLRKSALSIYFGFRKAIYLSVGFIALVLVISNFFYKFYKDDFPLFFKDFHTTVVNLTGVIMGGFISGLENKSFEFNLIVFSVFIFVGIMLLSFFVAYLVELNAKEVDADIIIGQINDKDVTITYNKWIKSYFLFYNGNTINIDGNSFIYPFNEFEMSDAIVLIDAFLTENKSKKEGLITK